MIKINLELEEANGGPTRGQAFDNWENACKPLTYNAPFGPQLGKKCSGSKEERWTLNQRVLGSSPSAPTTTIPMQWRFGRCRLFGGGAGAEPWLMCRRGHRSRRDSRNGQNEAQAGTAAGSNSRRRHMGGHLLDPGAGGPLARVGPSLRCALSRDHRSLQSHLSARPADCRKSREVRKTHQGCEKRMA